MMLNGKPVDALAMIVHRSAAQSIGRAWTKKLRMCAHFGMAFADYQGTFYRDNYSKLLSRRLLEPRSSLERHYLP